jgi:shikimate kinase
MTKNLILIGIVGVGKTTIGKLIAESLDKEFIDLDKQIEYRCGVNIPTIFEIEGEEGFRNRETFELQQIVENQQNYILSVGGGCVIRPQNRELMKAANSFVVQLYADVSVLVDRLSKSANKRPLFNNSDVKTKAQELYQARKQFYDEISHLTVNTSNMKPNEVVKKVIDEFLNS